MLDLLGGGTWNESSEAPCLPLQPEWKQRRNSIVLVSMLFQDMEAVYVSNVDHLLNERRN
jgi:hypothetical protein